MPVTLLARLDARIEEKSLLKHPFYQDWQAGKLRLEDLRTYAAQYYHFEASFPTILSAIHSRCPDPAVRQAILSNLWDEEYGPRNHVALWLQFAAALGLSREGVEGTLPLPETRGLVDALRDIATTHSYQEGLAAIYAYEKQVPAVAREKVRGLQEFYGLNTAEATEFFTLHMSLDGDHAAAEARCITEAARTPEEKVAVEESLTRSLDVWWRFLDGVRKGS